MEMRSDGDASSWICVVMEMRRHGDASSSWRCVVMEMRRDGNAS